VIYDHADPAAFAVDLPRFARMYEPDELRLRGYAPAAFIVIAESVASKLRPRARVTFTRGG